MAKKKTTRANNTYLIEGNAGDNPKLMGRSMANGRDSLYLEFYFGYKVMKSKSGNDYTKIDRHIERLGLFLWQAPRNPLERQQNKETLEIAKRIRFERGQELLNDAEGYRLKRQNKDRDFLEWMREYCDAYTKADVRNVRRAYRLFVEYLVNPDDKLTLSPEMDEETIAQIENTRERQIQTLKLRPQQLTKALVTGFADYLMRHYRGDGPHTAFKRFKKIIKAAIEAEILARDPSFGVVIKIDNGSLKKDVLSVEEIQQLISTHYSGENPDIRRAFIFCLYSGVRFCDVKDLTYGNVDFSNRLLQFEQAKTKGRSSASGVVIPLNEGMLNLIGQGKRTDRIFALPSHTMCLKALRHWVARAGIDKHITWHCARHSFAVNILNNGANIKTVASLLGHSGLSQTEKYTRAIDSLKEAAINSLPELKFE